MLFALILSHLQSEAPGGGSAKPVAERPSLYSGNWCMRHIIIPSTVVSVTNLIAFLFQEFDSVKTHRKFKVTKKHKDESREAAKGAFIDRSRYVCQSRNIKSHACRYCFRSWPFGTDGFFVL